MARKKIKSATDQRNFTLIYNDFLECDLLNYYEKMVYITLKRFADNDTMRAFPSLQTIHNITGISLSQVRRSIEHMEELGVLSVEHRINQEKGHQSNLYTLYDYAEVWKAESENEVATVINNQGVKPLKVAEHIAALESMGYTVQITDTKKELISTVASNEMSSNNIKSVTDYNILQQSSQPISVDQIKNQIGYDAIVASGDVDQRDLDAVVNIIHEAVTTTKESIRVGGEDKPVQVVYSRLVQLNREDIIYVLQKLEAAEKGGKMIKNHEAYLITLLYKAKDQKNLEYHNLGRLNGDF